MDEELTATLKYALAQKGKRSAVHLLRHVLDEEAKVKRENARELRLKRARLPELLVMETFPHRASVKA